MSERFLQLANSTRGICSAAASREPDGTPAHFPWACLADSWCCSAKRRGPQLSTYQITQLPNPRFAFFATKKILSSRSRSSPILLTFENLLFSRLHRFSFARAIFSDSLRARLFSGFDFVFAFDFVFSLLFSVPPRLRVSVVNN